MQNYSNMCTRLCSSGRWPSVLSTWQVTGQRWRGLLEHVLQKSATTNTHPREPPSLQPRNTKRNHWKHLLTQVEKSLMMMIVKTYKLKETSSYWALSSYVTSYAVLGEILKKKDQNRWCWTKDSFFLKPGTYFIHNPAHSFCSPLL